MAFGHDRADHWCGYAHCSPLGEAGVRRVRVRDQSDRRKVFLRVLPKSIEPLVPKYEAVGHAYMQLVEQYSDDELRSDLRLSGRNVRSIAARIGENRGGQSAQS